MHLPSQLVHLCLIVKIPFQRLFWKNIQNDLFSTAEVKWQWMDMVVWSLCVSSSNVSQYTFFDEQSVALLTIDNNWWWCCPGITANSQLLTNICPFFGNIRSDTYEWLLNGLNHAEWFMRNCFLTCHILSIVENINISNHFSRENPIQELKSGHRCFLIQITTIVIL